MKRTVNCGEGEPEQKQFNLPSEKEHLFNVTDIFTYEDEMGAKLNLDDNTISVKCEVVGGEEEGRTLLHRLNLDPNSRGFFATRLFLKALGLNYKGSIDIDTDDFVGRQFYATVVHNGKYANIDAYNFDKKIEQVTLAKVEKSGVEEIAWDDDIK